MLLNLVYSFIPHLLLLRGEAAERGPGERDVILQGEEIFLINADPVPRVKV